MKPIDVLIDAIVNHDYTFPTPRQVSEHAAQALQSAGYSIVHKDEVHGPTVERCAARIEDAEPQLAEFLRALQSREGEDAEA